jgi:hypothetical protein
MLWSTRVLQPSCFPSHHLRHDFCEARSLRQGRTNWFFQINVAIVL